MPSSYIDSLPPIVHAIIDLAPRKVIDVGPGYGKYGLMCREYLHDLACLDAVEVRQGRRKMQDVIYDHVFECDARSFHGWSSYELVLLVDVIEHMSKDDGHALLHAMLAGGAFVLVSTPKTFFEQHDPHNPHEEHVSLWDWTDFSRYAVNADISTVDSLIYVLK